MPWLKEHWFLAFWLPFPITLVAGIYWLLAKDIIVKGDLSRFLLYLVTFAALGVMFTPGIDEAIIYSTRLIFVAAVVTILYGRLKRR